MQNTVITSQESQLIEMFQVEELEQRLENKWEAEISTTTDSSGTSCTATIKCTF
ncbi:hypothetical protein [Runella salmonicolor]|uniref:Lantibiotic n=1 Tax=Runella salmonicolor TaxID=2950278 RepID=A0ABT1FWU2_9BACT|nr:hypothetical protein [Runella salmonicolor]MCP1384932.1 hypothetical protein [Runella salmonicolor]